MPIILHVTVIACLHWHNNCSPSDRLRRYVFQRCRLLLIVNVFFKKSTLSANMRHCTVMKWSLDEQLFYKRQYRLLCSTLFQLLAASAWLKILSIQQGTLHPDVLILQTNPGERLNSIWIWYMYMDAYTCVNFLDVCSLGASASWMLAV